MKKIPLTQGKVALVDDCDFEELSRFKWCAHRHRNTFYAVRNARIDGKMRTVLMHRAVLTPTKDQHVDHRDMDGLNNTRINLRIASRSNNAMNTRRPKNNTSGFKGVHFLRARNKWVTHIKINGKNRHVGIFNTPEEAQNAYVKAANELFGEFARV